MNTNSSCAAIICAALLGTSGSAAHAQSTVFDTLSKKYHLKLTKALSGADKQKPAEFSIMRNYVKDAKAKQVSSADFALIYSPEVSEANGDSASRWIRTQAHSIEGMVRSNATDKDDAWRFRTGYQFDRNLSKGRADFVSAGLKYEGDRDLRKTKFLFEARYSPTIPQLKLGTPQPGTPIESRNFIWRVSGGFDAGKNIDPAQNGEQNSTILRIAGTVDLYYFLNHTRNDLGLSDLYFYVSDRGYYLPKEDAKKQRNYLSAGLVFEVNENFTFGPVFRFGQDAPKFENTHSLTLTAGLKF